MFVVVQKVTYGEITERVSFACVVFETVGVTGRFRAIRRCFCLSCTDSRGLDLMNDNSEKDCKVNVDLQRRF